MPDYLDMLNKITFIEGNLRMAENYKDSLALEYLIRDPQMEDIVCRHFYCSSGDEFIRNFRSGDYRAVLDKRFKGESLLFHARKSRSRHELPNTHLLYCVRGRCMVRIYDEEMELKVGDTCIVADGVPHAYYNTSEDALVIHVALTAAFISLVLLPRMPQEYLRSEFFRGIVFREDTNKKYIYVSGSKADEMCYFLASAFYYHLFKPPMHEEIINSFMILFFSYLFAEYSAKSEGSGSAEMAPEQTLHQIRAYINANCRTVSLKELAEKFHFNESYLSQYLKKNTGQTFTSLIQSARISQAEKMLINTNQSVVEIAANVGYQNMSYFYKLFAEVNNCSPADYRARFLKSGQRVVGQETL